jgi:hypothetical protein
MKNLFIALLLVAVATLGALLVKQQRVAGDAQANAAAARQSVSELESNLATQETTTAKLRERLEDFRAEAAFKSDEAAAVRQMLEATNRARAVVGGGPGDTNSGPSSPWAALLKSPEMRQMMKTQQKVAMSSMIDKNYAKLFADLRLTPEQSATLKDMLLKKQLDSAELGMELASRELTATEREELVKKSKDATEAADAEIKDFLGGDNYAEFQEYQKTLGERMSVSGFKDQLSATMPMTSVQEQELIQAMTQERQGFKFTTDFNDKSKFSGDYASMFDEDRIGKYFDELDKLNQQYLSRAQGILSADQLAAFSKYLASQEAMQKAGMQMAAKILGGKKAAEPQ